MMYDLETLEFPKVLKEIEKCAACSLTKTKISTIEIKNDITIIEEELQETDEARLLINQFGDFPFGGLFDISDIINRIRLASILSISDFLAILDMFYCSKNCLSFYRELQVKKATLTNLDKYFSNLASGKELVKKISQIIDEKGEIYDNASCELLTIREKIKRLDQQLRAKMQELLQSKAKMLNENLIVMRNDRMCLCVKNEFKHAIKGVIHDESSSGSTFYIEPFSALEITNKITSYKEAEKTEIRKILQLGKKQV